VVLHGLLHCQSQLCCGNISRCKPYLIHVSNREFSSILKYTTRLLILFSIFKKQIFKIDIFKVKN
jgi:hypothetical protein